MVDSNLRIEPRDTIKSTEQPFFSELSNKLQAISSNDGLAIPPAIRDAFLYSLVASQLDHRRGLNQQYPGTLNWVYKSCYKKAILSDAAGLKHIVHRVGVENRPPHSASEKSFFDKSLREMWHDSREFFVNRFHSNKEQSWTWDYRAWFVISRLACCAEIGHHFGLVTHIQEFWALLSDDVRRGNVPEDERKIALILHEFYCCLLHIANTLEVKKDGQGCQPKGIAVINKARKEDSQDFVRDYREVMTGIEGDAELLKEYPYELLITLLKPTSKHELRAIWDQKADKISEWIENLRPHFFLEARLLTVFHETVTEAGGERPCPKDC